MPHKRNPIVSERITGMARLLRGYAQVGLENVALWHERDISHSSAERVILPDACLALDYMLAPVHRPGRGPGGRHRSDAGQPRGHPRSGLQPGRLAGPRRGRGDPGRCLSSGPGQRHEGMGNRRAVARSVGGRCPGRLSDSQLDECFDPTRFLANTGVVFDRLTSVGESHDPPVLREEQRRAAA